MIYFIVVKNIINKIKVILKLKKLEKFAYADGNYIPIIRKQTKKFLIEQIKKNKYADFLEIGCAIGYSGIVMLNSSKNSKLLTIEKDEKMIKMAKQNFFEVGLNNRVEIKLNDAKDELEKLVMQNKKFDFIFLDGPKGQYINYYDNLYSLLEVGGTLFIDDIDFHGYVKQEKVLAKHRTIITRLKQLIERLENDKNYVCKFYSIEDGFAICKKVG